jgi:hypothetical protein
MAKLKQSSKYFTEAFYSLTKRLNIKIKAQNRVKKAGESALICETLTLFN